MKKNKFLFLGLLLTIFIVTNVVGYAQSVTPESEFGAELTEDNTGVIVSYGGNRKNIVIPATIQGMPVREIGNIRGMSLATVVIPEGVTKIKGSAFYDDTNLTSITLPKSLTSIEAGAFYRCSSLKSITIPDSVTSIDANAFANCSSLTSITIPKGVTEIADSWPYGAIEGKDGMFVNCENLTSVIIPDGITKIGVGAFGGCRKLTTITLPKTVTVIGYAAFMNCTNLKSINIPDGVTEIKASAFRNCSSLSSITIPDSVEKFGQAMGAIYEGRVFSGCSSLVTVNISPIVRSWTGFSNFGGCPLKLAVQAVLKSTGCEYQGKLN